MSQRSFEDDPGLAEDVVVYSLDDDDSEPTWKRVAAVMGCALVMFVPTGCEANFETDDGVEESEEEDADVDLDEDEVEDEDDEDAEVEVEDDV